MAAGIVTLIVLLVLVSIALFAASLSEILIKLKDIEKQQEKQFKYIRRFMVDFKLP